MNAIFDVIAAFAIGAMFILTMMNTMFNIQNYGYNIEAMMILTETSKVSVDVLDRVVLANIGSDEVRRTNGTVFEQNLLDNTMRFWGLLDVNNDNVLDDVYIQIRIDANNQLQVRYSTVYPNPTWVTYYRAQLAANGLQFVYLDADDNVIATPITAAAANANPPAGVQITVNFEEQGRGETDFGSFATLQNQIVFWRYFKSLHI